MVRGRRDDFADRRSIIVVDNKAVMHKSSNTTGHVLQCVGKGWTCKPQLLVMMHRSNVEVNVIMDNYA